MSGTGAAGGSWRIGVDVGGTFTDLVGVDRDGRIHVHKVPTTPSDPAEGVLSAIATFAGANGLTTHELLRRGENFSNGLTQTNQTDFAIPWRSGEDIGRIPGIIVHPTRLYWCPDICADLSAAA